ncbi:hypothetical protein VC83_05279 [Pseudogymnoascus destructans]|uniref:AGA1 A-agglutinin anchor subunit n=2 Tax=Pseudogymnoascus destructans TaxID=655981 RepID=L8G0M6_PSED2|nr:uncharacterized protein VC83_05279 [Pseudogymnoascus destructans]ELR06662.1 hypothetical protein GMDG_00279 [Pseudogymnoascus destructans 20631-21]OAF58079.1 hypothetical protein VC83_05279 [Pseudogymnoascus destructans]
MATAPLPSRTRSIRKPNAGIDLKSRLNGLNSEQAPDAPRGRSRGGDAIDSARTGSQSPSKLPMRPPSSTTSTSRLTRTGSPSHRAASASTRPGSNDGSMRPPRSVTTRPPLSSDNRPSVSRPPLSCDNQRGAPLHSSSKTPTEQSSSTGLQRRPSTTSRHARTTSIGSAPSIRPPASKHTRNTSVTQLSSTTTLRPPSETKQAPNPALHRPNFSTLQQHYSPAKSIAPKPTTASLLAAPSPSKLPSNVAISAETARLQAELLQLHLLHRDAASVQDQWLDSARNKLGHKFETLVRKHGGLVAQEEAQHGQTNALALKVWADSGMPGCGLEEKIQVLDEVVTGVWRMGESGGKYARIVRRFERWMHTVVDIHQRRERGHLLDGDEVMFIEDIDGSWSDDCRVQARKLEEWRDKLADLGKVEVKSSLATAVEGYTTLVRGMLEELDTMRRIEKEVMMSEQVWIKEMISDAGDEEDVPVRSGAAWHR